MECGPLRCGELGSLASGRRPGSLTTPDGSTTRGDTCSNDWSSPRSVSGRTASLLGKCERAHTEPSPYPTSLSEGECGDLLRVESNLPRDLQAIGANLGQLTGTTRPAGTDAKATVGAGTTTTDPHTAPVVDAARADRYHRATWHHQARPIGVRRQTGQHRGRPRRPKRPNTPPRTAPSRPTSRPVQAALSTTTRNRPPSRRERRATTETTPPNRAAPPRPSALREASTERRSRSGRAERSSQCHGATAQCGGPNTNNPRIFDLALGFGRRPRRSQGAFVGLQGSREHRARGRGARYGSRCSVVTDAVERACGAHHC